MSKDSQFARYLKDNEVLRFDFPYNKKAQKFASTFTSSKRAKWQLLKEAVSFVDSISNAGEKKAYIDSLKEYFNAKVIKSMLTQAKGNPQRTKLIEDCLNKIETSKGLISGLYELPNVRAHLESQLFSNVAVNKSTTINDVFKIRDKHLKKFKSVSDDVTLFYLQTKLNDPTGENLDFKTIEDPAGRGGKVNVLEFYSDNKQKNVIANVYTRDRQAVEGLDIYDTDKEGFTLIESAERLVTDFVNYIIDLHYNGAISEARYCLSGGLILHKVVSEEEGVFEFGGSDKVFRFNTLFVSIKWKKGGIGISTMTTEGKSKELIMISQGKKRSYKSLITNLVEYLLKALLSALKYDESLVGKVLKIISYDIWQVFVPIGGCGGTLINVPNLFNVSDKFFRDNVDEVNRCLIHCIAYLLTDNQHHNVIPLEPYEDKQPLTSEFGDRNSPVIIAIESVMRELRIEVNHAVSVNNAKMIIMALRKNGLDPKNKLTVPIIAPTTPYAALRKNAIVFHENHYFLWKPINHLISDNKEVTGEMTPEDVRKMLDEKEVDPDVLSHIKRKDGKIVGQDVYLHIPYDYECKKDKTGKYFGRQIPTQCGYIVPDELIYDDQVYEDVYNEKGIKVNSVAFIAQDCKTPGLRMIEDIIKRILDKYMEKTFDEDMNIIYVIKEEFKGCKLRVIFNAYNGANYDTILLMREMLTSKYNVYCKNTCFHSGKLLKIDYELIGIRDVTISLVDIARFTVLSLDFNGEIFKVDAQKGATNYDIIDYKENMDPEEYKGLIKYLMHDVYVLNEVTKVLRNNFAKLFDKDVFDYVSLPQMVYSFWSENYCPNDIFKPATIKLDKFIRKSAYGGIVYNYNREYESPRHTHEVVCPNPNNIDGVDVCPSFVGGRCNNEECQDVLIPYDVNSLYPAACIFPFPVGECFSLLWDTIAPEARDKLYEKILSKQVSDYLAVFSVFIESVPERFNKIVKIFPRRGKNGMSCEHKIGEKLHLTSIQMYDMLTYGYKFRIHRVCYWEQKRDVLAAFMKNYYEARKICKARGDGVMEQIIKLILNSLTGKFLQRNEDSNAKFTSRIDQVVERINADKVKVLFKLQPIGEEKITRDWFFIQEMKDEVNPNKPVQLSAFLLSYSKRIMMSYMEQFGVIKPPYVDHTVIEGNYAVPVMSDGIGPYYNHLCYMDTDSLYINRLAAYKSGFIENKDLGRMKNDLKTPDSYVTKGLFLGKKMYMVETRRALKPTEGAKYKSSTKGLNKPNELTLISDKKYCALLAKGQFDDPHEEEYFNKLNNKYQKYLLDTEMLWQTFTRLNDECIDVVKNNLKFTKSFKGDTSLSVVVDDSIAKIIRTKCKCASLDDHHSGKCYKLGDNGRKYLDCMPETHHNSRKCPIIVAKAKQLKEEIEAERINKRIHECICDIKNHEIHKCSRDTNLCYIYHKHKDECVFGSGVSGLAEVAHVKN
jgi:hypothetical protein